MKIVIIGGTGLIGAKLVAKLTAKGHTAIAASPGTGVNIITGDGLAAVLEGTDVVVDVTNSPSFEDKAVLEFFTKAGQNITAAEQAAKVGHHVAVSIVGTDLLPDSGYLRAKVAQENLIKASSVPYTILRSTQFFEFLGGIASSGAKGDAAHISTGLVQPIAAEDLANAIVDIVLAPPVNGTIEIGGPDRFPLADLVRQYLAATGDPREVIGEASTPYFGTALKETSLVPVGPHLTGSTDFKAWLAQGK